jgi:hypothetical protein
MFVVRSKSPCTCELCARAIPVGTEIASEKQKSWHLDCYKTVESANKHRKSTVSALRAAGLESEADALDEAFEPLRLDALMAACQRANTALEQTVLRGGGAQTQDALVAVAALRELAPAGLAGNDAAKKIAAALISGEISRIREGE